MDVDDDARTIGRRLRQIRKSRDKPLVVIAGLAGISKSHLSRIELGERALDSRSELVALANALQIAPSELTTLPVPAPANGDNNAAVKAIRRALIPRRDCRLHPVRRTATAMSCTARSACGRPVERRGRAGRPRIGSPPVSLVVTWGLSPVELVRRAFGAPTGVPARPPGQTDARGAQSG